MDTKLVGIFIVFFFFWTTDAGLKHVPSLAPLPVPEGSVRIPTSTAATVNLGLQSPPNSLPQGFHLSMPSRNGSELYQSTYRNRKEKPSRLQVPRCRVHRCAGPGGGCVCTLWGGYGARRRGPARWPWQMTLVSLFLEDTGVRRNSTSVIKYSVREGRSLPVS